MSTCPFPDKNCMKDDAKVCPFKQLRCAFNEDGTRSNETYWACVWKEEIKPTLEKERKAQELVKKAWEYLDKK